MVDISTNRKIQILSLYRANYRAEYHIREMAKLTQNSHVTLLPYLRALEEQAILISKKVGKNKTYSLNFENILTKHYLLLAETTQTILLLEEVFLLKKIITDLVSHSIGGTFVLFGSYAKRTFEDKSDIDILTIGSKGTEEIEKIRNIYGKTINVKRTTMNNFASGLRKNDPLLKEIVKNHILLLNPEPFITTLWKYYYEIR